MKDIEEIRKIADPEERARQAHALLGQLQVLQSQVSGVRAEAVAHLRDRGSSWPQVGEILGVTKQWARLIGASGPPPERVLLAPEEGPLRICVVAKEEAERGGPVITQTTVAARDKLAALAGSWNLEVVHEVVGTDGMIDLNRPNLAVLIGPRSSALVAQALPADPVIRWLPDGNGDWYITDIRAGAEYHSDFDRDAARRMWPRTCYAHIGRIRRPDGNGSWLCLAGEHRPGVAGAAEFVCTEAASLWETAGRKLWSAVVRAGAAEDGTVRGVHLVSQVYVHGKR